MQYRDQDCHWFGGTYNCDAYLRATVIATVLGAVDFFIGAAFTFLGRKFQLSPNNVRCAFSHCALATRARLLSNQLIQYVLHGLDCLIVDSWCFCRMIRLSSRYAG